MNSNQKLVVNSEDTIDLRRLFNAILRKFWAVVLAAVIGAGAAFLGTFYFITPKYRSSALFYVNGNSLSVGSISLSDLSAAKDLVKSYIVILKSRETLNSVIDYAGIDYSYAELSGMISAASVNDTEIFQVYVTSDDPHEAEKIANAVAYILPKRIESIIDGATAKIVDYAVVPSAPFSPNHTKNTLIGLLAGAALALAIIVIQDIIDITIRTSDDLSNVTTLPVLAAIPDMNTVNTSHKKKRKKKVVSINEQSFLGNRMSFAAAEANKLLRTKLLFSFVDGEKNRVIGVSSSMTGEGKTITAINLAYSLAQLHKKVLLIDCDLRRPSVYKKLSIEKAPGLSEYLTGQLDNGQIVKLFEFKDSASGFDTIVSGENPPNPMELISSEKMRNLIEEFRNIYDYVIIDLPPIGEVSDSLAVADYVDGMLLVVRQNYCNRVALADAISQFEFVNTKLIGIALNCSNDDVDGYGRYKYARYGKYRRYYKYRRYGYGSYRRAYLATMKKAKEQKAEGAEND
ncbi:MAG: polysaccharide biosynthesis tyrosine autokinase [Clostridia bacterium]|nr:polysaccharide biosynthesis tyrosine autokinase [Clostridia bacterium]